MKKSIISSIIALSCASTNAGVVSLTNTNLGGIGDIIIVNASDNFVNSGIAAAGYFTSGFNVAGALATGLSTGDFTPLISNFTVLTSGDPMIPGDATSVIGGGAGLGQFFATVDYGTPGLSTPGSPPLNSLLYAFLGNAATLLDSSQFALLSSSLTIDSDAPTPDSNDLILADSVNGGNLTVLLGTPGLKDFDFGSVIGVAETPTLGLVAIPEPSSLLLGGLGMLALLRRKR